MGAIYSLKNDYNRVLAKHTPYSADPKPSNFEIKERSELDIPLTIPDFTHLRKNTSGNSTISSENNEQATTNYKPLEKTSLSNQLSLIPINQGKLPHNPETNSQLTAKSPDENSSRSISVIFQPQSTEQTYSMPEDIAIISRTAANLNPQPMSINPDQKRFQLTRSIIDHNGKKYFSEMYTRSEQRFIQWYDPSVERLRFFEVTDYVPTRMVRPFSLRSSSSSRSEHPLIPVVRQSIKSKVDLDMKPTNPEIKSTRRISKTSINSSSTIRSVVPRTFSKKSSVSSSNSELTRITNRTSKKQSAIPLPPPSGNSDGQEYSYNQFEKNNSNNKTEVSSISKKNQSTSSYKRPQSVGSLFGTERSIPDYQSEDQITYEDDNDNESETNIDPFAQPKREGTYYQRRRTENKYSEPLRLYGQTASKTKSDYTPISNNRTNSNFNRI